MQIGYTMTEYNIIADASDINDTPYQAKNIIALDGAAELLNNAGILPYAIIGDMDEVSQSTLKSYEQRGVNIILVDDQNSTDLDKGINYCLEQGASIINIYNAIGGRLDHTLYNLRCLKKYNGTAKIVLINGKETIEYLQDQTVEVISTAHSLIAIISAPLATVTSQGLKYDMQNYKLEFGAKESSSNSMAQSPAKISISGGAFLIRTRKSEIIYL